MLIWALAGLAGEMFGGGPVALLVAPTLTKEKRRLMRRY
jgi:hypothetical protein